MKKDLILVHSVTQINTKPITEYLNKHVTNFVYKFWFATKRTKPFISVKKEESFTQLKLHILTFHVSTLSM